MGVGLPAPPALRAFADAAFIAVKIGLKSNLSLHAAESTHRPLIIILFIDYRAKPARVMAHKHHDTKPPMMPVIDMAASRQSYTRARIA